MGWREELVEVYVPISWRRAYENPEMYIQEEVGMWDVGTAAINSAVPCRNRIMTPPALV